MHVFALFKRPGYLALALGVALGTFVCIVLTAQLRFLSDLLPDAGISVASKLYVLWSLGYGSLTEGSLTTVLTAAISLLFGIHTAAVVYYVRLYRATAVSAIASIGTGGLISGILALGCVSCGSLAAAFLSSFFSASSLFIFLPYQSIGFGMLSMVLLLLSLYILNRKLRLAMQGIS